MESTIEAKKLIQGAHDILILLPRNIQEDSLGSAFGLFYSFKRLKKKVNIFLTAPLSDDIRNSGIYNLLQPKNFVISIDTTQKKISEIFYEKTEKNLKIHLTLAEGHLDEKDLVFSYFPHNLSTQVNKEKPDLLIILGAKSLNDLGDSFKKNNDFFNEIPILSINNCPDDENFGEVNLKESSSLARLSTNLVKSLDETIIDKEIATSFLAGILYSSLQDDSSEMKPETFGTISYLIKKSADVQKIVQHLKTKTEPDSPVKKISQIRLLSKVLEKLSYDEKKILYHATLTTEDFEDSKASSQDLNFVVTELKNSWRFPSLLLLWKDEFVKGVIYSSCPETTKKVLENFSGVSKGKGGIFVVKETDLSSAREKVLNIL
ncbi:MAG: hypothetical protein ABH919_03250 [bacterium]